MRHISLTGLHSSNIDDFLKFSKQHSEYNQNKLQGVGIL